MRMDVAENPDWVAYVNIDVAFRAMSGGTRSRASPARSA